MFNNIEICVVLLVSFITIICIILLLVLLVYIFAPQLNYTQKFSAYECGFKTFQSTRTAVNIHFFVLGIIFLIFDMELMFLYPWVFVNYISGYFGLFAVFFFLIIITIGFVYEYKEKLLNLNI